MSALAVKRCYGRRRAIAASSAHTEMFRVRRFSAKVRVPVAGVAKLSAQMFAVEAPGSNHEVQQDQEPNQ